MALDVLDRRVYVRVQRPDFIGVRFRLVYALGSRASMTLVPQYLYEPDPEDLDELFGALRINGEPLRREDLRPPEVVVDPATGRARWQLDAYLRQTIGGPVDIVREAWEQTRVRASDRDLFVIGTDDGTLLTAPLPWLKRPRFAIYQLKGQRIIFANSIGKEGRTTVISGESGRRVLGRMSDALEGMRHYGSGAALRLVVTGIRSLVLALPLIVGLFLLRPVARFEPAAFSAAVTRRLLTFHFVAFGFQALAGSGAQVSRLLDWLARQIDVYPWFQPPRFYSDGAALLGMAFLVAVIAPVLASTPGHTPLAVSRAWRAQRAVVAALALAMGGIGLLTVLAHSEGPAPAWSYMLVSGSLLFLLLWRSVASLAIRLPVVPRIGSAMACALLTTALCAASWVLIWWHPKDIDLNRGFWTLATIVSGALLIRSFATLGEQVARPAVWFEGTKRWVPSLWGSCAALVLALPLAPSEHGGWNPGASQLLALATNLDSLVIPLWALTMLWPLWSTGRHTLRLNRFARWGAIVTTAALLAPPSQIWLFLPIPFLVSFLLLDRALILPRADWDRVRRLVDPVVKRRKELISDILELRDIEQADREHRAKLRARLVAGELTITQYDQQGQRWLRWLTRRRGVSEVAGEAPRRIALAFGPKTTAWGNAAYGTIAAAVFALPWIVLGIGEILDRPVFASGYPLWDIAADISFLVLQWLAYGFFLGYLFPYMRGRNGLEKGFGLFLAATLPALFLGTVVRQGQDWAPLLFWMLQVLIHCLLLGLVAFDLATVRRSGYRDWRLVFEVLGMPRLGVSVSTLVAAIGAALVTLLSDQAGQLVSLALKFVVPQLDIGHSRAPSRAPSCSGPGAPGDGSALDQATPLV